MRNFSRMLKFTFNSISFDLQIPQFRLKQCFWIKSHLEKSLNIVNFSKKKFLIGQINLVKKNVWAGDTQDAYGRRGLSWV